MLELVLQSGAGLAFVEAGISEFFEDPAGVALGVTLWVLLLGGSLLMLLASVGLIRLPDLPTRMHASTKAGSLGAALIMLAVAVAMPSADVWARSIAVIAFLLLTAPVAAHVIGRAGYFVGVPLWEGTVKDELAEKYDYRRHTLESGSLGEREIEGLDEDEIQGGDESNGEEKDIADAWSEHEEVGREGGEEVEEETEDVDDGDDAEVSKEDDAAEDEPRGDSEDSAVSNEDDTDEEPEDAGASENGDDKPEQEERDADEVEEGGEEASESDEADGVEEEPETDGEEQSEEAEAVEDDSPEDSGEDTAQKEDSGEEVGEEDVSDDESDDDSSEKKKDKAEPVEV